MSLEELARTILNDSRLPKCFWVDVVSTACYVMNRVLIRPILKKTPYELLNERKPNVSHLKVFGCKCYVLNNGKESLGMFDAKSDKGIFLGYSLNSHAYRVFNKKLIPWKNPFMLFFMRLTTVSKLQLRSIQRKIQPIETLQQEDLPKDWKVPKDLSIDNIIGQIQRGVSTRRHVADFCNHSAFVSKIEPQSVCEALKDEFWTTTSKKS